jgi:phage terminase large subunit-like protein
MPRVNEELVEVVVGVDPACGGDCRTGIVVVGKGQSGHLYILADRTSDGTPAEWSMAVAVARKDFSASTVVAESNAGGSMVEAILKQADPQAVVRLVHAGVSKQLRAEPIASLAECGLLHHVGEFPELEDEMLSWKQGSESPDRMDAAVHAAAHFIAEGGAAPQVAAMAAILGAEDEAVWNDL